MKKDYYSTVIGILGVIFVLVTLGVFFILNVERTSLEWWALSFVLTAEIISFSSLFLLEKSVEYSGKLFIKSGIYSTVFLYFLAAALFSIFVGAFENRSSSFIIIQIIIIAIAVSIALLIITFSHRFSSEDKQTLNSSKMMELCNQKVSFLLADAKNKNYAEQLSKLKENIGYIDKIGTSSVDDTMLAQIEKLEKALLQTEGADNDITSSIDEICTLAAHRRIEMTAAKRGGF